MSCKHEKYISTGVYSSDDECESCGLLRSTVEASKPMSLQKESGWEKDLASLLVEHGIAVKNVTLEEKLWKLFSKVKSQSIATREKEIAEEVEKYALYCKKESAKQLGRENVMLAYDMDSRQVAAKQILQIIKH